MPALAALFTAAIFSSAWASAGTASAPNVSPAEPTRRWRRDRSTCSVCGSTLFLGSVIARSFHETRMGEGFEARPEALGLRSALPAPASGRCPASASGAVTPGIRSQGPPRPRAARPPGRRAMKLLTELSENRVQAVLRFGWILCCLQRVEVGHIVTNDDDRHHAEPVVRVAFDHVDSRDCEGLR